MRKTREKKTKKNTRKKNTKTKSILKNISTYFITIMVVFAIAFIFQVWDLNTFPIKYLIPGTIVVALLVLVLSWLQTSKKVSRMNRNLGRVIITILCIVMGVGNVSLYQARAALGKVTVQAGDTEYEIISVVVKADNKAEKLKDIETAVFAIPETIDVKHTEQTVTNINEELDTTIETKSYANTNDQAEALIIDEVEAMILNEAYRSLLDEKYPTFQEDTKVIYTYKIPKEVKELGKAVNVNEDPYNVYISGIDTYGPIGSKSRSDVNMIATVNPTSKQIVLTSIPRDYYVAQTCQGNQKDKLTHTGIFGVDCTIESMQNFTDLTFNYYIRVNFSSLESIVDAIGGINVYNEMSFYSGVDGTFIPGGEVHMNGNLALKFARERHAYADGDSQRGRNQMIVLEQIIAKATSPAIISGYSGIMDAVGNSFQTNMTSNEMTSIVKEQLDKGGSWNIVQQSVTGSGGTDWTPANGFNAYVMYPDATSVANALAVIQQVMDGKQITQ